MERTERRPSSIHGAGRRQKTRPGHTFQPASAPAHKLNHRDLTPFKWGGGTTSPPLDGGGGAGETTVTHVFATFPHLGSRGKSGSLWWGGVSWSPSITGWAEMFFSTQSKERRLQPENMFPISRMFFVLIFSHEATKLKKARKKRNP